MSLRQIQLSVVSQEHAILTTRVDYVIAPTTTGEITVLPDHIPLFSLLQPGELRYREDGLEHSLAISKGFLNVAPGGDSVTVMVDVAVQERDISVQKAQEAVKKAHETKKLARDQRELLLAEAELRFALIQEQIAARTRKGGA